MKINYAEHTIVITKKEERAAGKVGTSEYAAFLEVRRNFPDFSITIQEPKKRDTYKGLTFEYMETYIQKKKAKGEDMSQIEKEFADLTKKSADFDKTASYGEVKTWFLSKFPEIENFEAQQKRKEIIQTAKTTIKTRKENRAA